MCTAQGRVRSRIVMRVHLKNHNAGNTTNQRSNLEPRNLFFQEDDGEDKNKDAGRIKNCRVCADTHQLHRNRNINENDAREFESIQGYNEWIRNN